MRAETLMKVYTLAGILISGLLWYLSSGLSGNYWYLLWLAPIPVLLSAFHVSAKQAFILAFIAYLLGRLSWLSYLLTVVPTALAILFTILLPLIFASIILMVRKIVLIVGNAWSAFAFPVLWSSFEFLVYKFSPDGTAGSIAYSQSNFLQIIQIASVTGILGITFLVTLFPSAVAVAIYYRSNKKMIAPLSVVFCLIAIAIIFGVIRIVNESSDKNVITVGLAVLDEKFHSETNHPNPDAELNTANMYANEVVKLAKQGAQVVVLPEKIVNVTPAFDDSIKSIIANASVKNRVAIVAGYTEFINDGLKQNKALAISGNGILLADYQKVNLFEGEARNRFVPGKEIAVFDLNNIHSGVAICKDLDFQNFIKKYNEGNSEILFVPAWDFIKDGWLHSRMAILRGVENGYAIVRTARQGNLTISDYRGEVLYEATSTGNKATTLPGRISPRSTNTIYSRFGDWFGILNLIVALYFITLVFSKRRIEQMAR